MSVAQKCLWCGKNKWLEKDFDKNKVRPNGYMAICKDCRGKISNLDEFKNYLSDNDIEYLDNLWSKAQKEAQKYIKRKYKNQELPENIDEIEFKTTINQYFKIGNLNGGYKLVNSSKKKTVSRKNKANIDITEEMIYRWGYGLDPRDYEYLEKIYQELISTYRSETPIQKMLYEDIAKTRLEAEKARISGNVSTYKELLKTISALMNDANIKPVQETAADNEGLSTWGEWVRKIEQEEPIPEPRDEFKDVDGIRKYIEAWFVGHMKTIFGLENSSKPNMDDFEGE